MMSGDFMMFNVMSTVFPILFISVFVIVIGAFIMTAVRGVKEWSHNNQQPVLNVEASVVAKRQELHRHRDGPSSTWHYVTFQVQSGDRMEFSLTGSEYGMLAEGDHGKLTFQGTRYLSFERA